MNHDWGVPNWREKSAYGDTSKWTDARWKWEFFRRREDVRSEFAEHAQASYDRIKPEYDTPTGCFSKGETPDQPGFTSWSPRLEEWGISIGLPNPSIGEQPHVEDLFRIDHSKVVVGKASHPYYVQQEQPWIHLPVGTVAIVFDLRRPIPRQLAAAKLELKKFEKVKGKRRHPETWLQYLRILDAKDDEQTLETIARHVMGLDPNRQDSAIAAASVAVNSARALMSNFDY